MSAQDPICNCPAEGSADVDMHSGLCPYYRKHLGLPPIPMTPTNHSPTVKVFLVDEEYYAASTKEDAIRCHFETFDIPESEIGEIKETPNHTYSDDLYNDGAATRPMIEQATADAAMKPLPFHLASQNV